VTGGGRVVIVGGGQAAASCIAALRAKDASRPIVLVGAEEHLPNQRPPLSKAALLDDIVLADSMLIRPAQWYEGVGLRLGCRVEEIARGDGRLVLSNGEQLAYDQLVLCTGSRARRLGTEIGGELAGVHTLRSLADASKLRAELLPGRRILVVGGGYIGLEVAVAARKRGLSVLLVEAGPSVLGRVASAATAEYFRALHGARGVEIREATNLDGWSAAGWRSMFGARSFPTARSTTSTSLSSASGAWQIPKSPMPPDLRPPTSVLHRSAAEPFSLMQLYQRVMHPGTKEYLIKGCK
jgi:NADPH-dependent 2,4-dienoyl-CoA reductase/sulfur reductase-like enzyme